MKLNISHTTEYAYDTEVNYALQQVRLTPLDTVQQKVLDWKIDVTGGHLELEYKDHNGNHVLLIKAEPGIQSLKFKAEGQVQTMDTAGIFGQSYGAIPLWYYKKSTERTTANKIIRDLSKIIGSTDDAIADFHRLSTEILEVVPFGTGNTFAGTTAEQAINAGMGVCQDHSQIFLAAARHAGVPARYISGYLLIDDRIEQDASHAWAEAHIDGLGWVGFDVSNRISPDERYIRLASGMDSRDTAPISGVRIGGAVESMIVSLQVQQ